MNFSSSVAYSIDYIKELDFYQTLSVIATIVGILGFLFLVQDKWKQRKKLDPISKLESKFDDLSKSIRPVETAPLPVMDFVDGLPQLDDAKKREAFKTAMKLRGEHKHLEAIKRFRFLLSMNPSYEQQAAILTLIGNSFIIVGNQDEALGHHKEALKAVEKAHNLGAKGVTLGNIGLIYRTKGDPDEALKYLEQALSIFESIGAKHLANQTSNNINTTINQPSYTQ